MDIKQINQTLAGIFKEAKKRIVFWYDGVKMNYGKFGNLLAERKAITGE